MKNNDDLLSVQGSVYTLVDSEGYLVREDTKNGRFRYPIKDDDTKYLAGDGLVLSGNVFSVDYTKVAQAYEAGTGLTLSGQTFSIDTSIVASKNYVNEKTSNKQKVKIGLAPLSSTLILEYDPNYDVFINTVSMDTNTLQINPIDFTQHSLDNGETATLESWISTVNQANIETLSINENIVVVGDIPQSLSGTFTHVFVRRAYKDNSSNIHESLSYAYSF